MPKTGMKIGDTKRVAKVRNERTSARIAKLAAKVLDGYMPTLAEAKSLAGSALTQTRDRKKPKAKKRKKAGRALL